MPLVKNEAEESFVEVANYSALPPANTATGKTYAVLNEQGTSWLPGSLGGTYYNKGLYYSNGVDWVYNSTPYNASLAVVNAGANDNQFITPYTFTNASKWATKEDVLTFSTGLTRTVNTITNNLSTGVSGGQTAIGGTGVGDALTLKATTGNGTLTSQGIIFGVGNNGATIAASIYNNGNWNIGNVTTASQRILRIGHDSMMVDVGSRVGSTTSQWAIYGGLIASFTPGATNYSLGGTGTNNTVLNVPGTTNDTSTVSINFGATQRYNWYPNKVTWIPVPSTAGTAPTVFLFQTPNSLGQTSGAETIGVDFDISATIQHASNTLIASNRDILHRGRTHAFATAGGIISDAYTAYTIAPIAGTNATLTRSWAQGFEGNIVVSGSSYFGGFGVAPNSTVHINGSISTAYQVKSATYTLTASDRTIEVDTAGATQTLPTAVGCSGREYRIINASTGIVRANTTSSQTIGNANSGNPTFIDLNPEEWLDIVSNGTNWRII